MDLTEPIDIDLTKEATKGAAAGGDRRKRPLEQVAPAMQEDIEEEEV
jgi:hypothetical protein